MRSAPLTRPTSTSILKMVSPTYCQDMVTADREVSNTGPLVEANAEKIMQARTMTTPSMHTPT